MWMDKTVLEEDVIVKGKKIPVSERTCIMGILNITPDSFSDGGKYMDPDAAVEKAKGMVTEGADIIDVGGESSRPGAEPVSLEEELKRVLPVIEALSRAIDVPVSIDTYKSIVAKEALKAGAAIVNDITALNGDPDMAGTIAEFDAGVVLMHMKGDPKTMQKNTEYDDVIPEIFSYLLSAVDRAVEAGIDRDKIIVDPGIGFGKRVHDNLVILNELKYFEELGRPILVGTSRKSFIGEITGKKTDDRFFGTAASITAAIMNGANIIRVHDVSQMYDVTRVADAIEGV